MNGSAASENEIKLKRHSKVRMCQNEGSTNNFNLHFMHMHYNPDLKLCKYILFISAQNGPSSGARAKPG